MGVFDVSCIFS